jgi:hypothetical protein
MSHCEVYEVKGEKKGRKKVKHNEKTFFLFLAMVMLQMKYISKI